MPSVQHGVVPPNCLHSLFLFEGLPSEVQGALTAVKDAYPGATEVSLAEATRHRAWFAIMTSGFQALPLTDHITVAIQFETPLTSEITSAPPVLAYVKNRFGKADPRLSVGFAAIDTRQDPSAVAIAVCIGCDKRVVGSIGGNRSNYFEVMRHLFYGGDEELFLNDLITEKAIGPIPYNDHDQWSDSKAPLRLQFRTSDPRRDNWSLRLESAAGCKQFLVRGGHLPPEQISVAVYLGWLDALTIIASGENYDILPFFDDDGQLMISGYALHSAGLIDEDLKPTQPLTRARCARFGLSFPTSDDRAMIVFLELYLEWLIDALHAAEGNCGAGEWQSRLRDHLTGASKWLVEYGHIKVINRQPTSGTVN